MKLHVAWSHACEADVLRMDWRAAAQVCKAVIDLSEGLPVPVERVRPGDRLLLRVRARGGEALVRIEPETRTLLVWRVYPARR